MTERVVEYMANALWQLPLLAVGAWCLLRAVRVGALAQYRVWVAVLMAGVLLPLARVSPKTVVVRPVEINAAMAGSDLSVAEVRPVVAHERVDWLAGVLRRRSVEVSASTARGLAGFYFVLVMLGLVRIWRGLSAARRLVAGSEDVFVGDALREMLNECGERIGVGVPRVVESAEVSSPAVVGSVLVLPEGFVEFSEGEMRAALLHELAHLRRRDYAANVLCEVAALPVVWHPVSYAVRRRIRGTREMVCDGIAAAAMGSAKVYARSLVGLAAKACVGGVEAEPMAVGLFTNNNLEERVMRLMEPKRAVDGRASVVRILSAAAGMIAVVTLAAMVHVRPAMAQETAAPSAAQTVGQVPADGVATGVAEGAEGASAVPPLPALPATAPAQPLPALPALPPAGLPAPPAAAMLALPAVPALAAPAPQAMPEPPAAPAPMPEPEGLQLVAGEVMDEGGKDCPMGHATTVHRWVAEDGKNFAVVDCNTEEPTAGEKKRLELKYKKEMADAQTRLAELKFDDAGMQAELAKLKSPEFRARLAKQIGEAQKLNTLSKADRLRVQKQLAELSSPEFKAKLAKQMDDARLQIELSKLDALNVRKIVNEDVKVQIEKQLDQARLQLELSKLDSEDMQKQIEKVKSPEFKKQLDEQVKQAEKQVEEAQKLLKQSEERRKKHPATACAEGCVDGPQ